MMKRTYYDILGITPQATLAEIKAAHRLLVKQLHPDIQRTASREQLLDVMRAYRVLTHPAQRQAYDAQLARKGYGTARALQSLSTRLRHWLAQWTEPGVRPPVPPPVATPVPAPIQPVNDSFDQAIRQASRSGTSPYNRDNDGVIRRATPDRNLPEVGSLRRGRPGAPQKTPLAKAHPWDLWRR